MRYCMAFPFLFDFKLDTAILGSSRFGIVRRDRTRVAISDGSHTFGGDSRLLEILGHGLGASTRQLQIGIITADRIRVSRYFDLGVRTSHRDRRQMIEHR